MKTGYFRWGIYIFFMIVSARGLTTAPTDLVIKSMFLNATSTRFIPDIQDAYGAAFRDINQDGWPDLYMVCFRGLNRLLINQGPEKPFFDATIQSGLGGNLMPMGIVNLELGTTIVDIDNDGDGDIVLAGWGETVALFRNDLQLRFVDITEMLVFNRPTDANACVAADVNNDGKLDLFFTDEHYGNHLLIQSERGRFYEKSDEWGLMDIGISQGASFCDVDLDGDPDLYVTNWFGPDFFYRNTGANHFVKMNLPLPSCQMATSTNAPCFGDLDNDGDFDLIVTHRQGRNFIYFNQTFPGDSNWVFKDISEASGLDDPGISYGCAIADFDHDGWQDVFISNIGSNRFYKNLKYGVFQCMTCDAIHGIRDDAYSTGISVGDIDEDGDLDLFVANKDTFSQIYINPINDSASVKLQIQGVNSNRDGIGTRVALFRAGHMNEDKHLIGMREVQGGGGYLSMNELTLHFGLDTVRYVDAQINFPSGHQVIKKNIRAGSSSVIYERAAFTRWVWHARQSLVSLIQQPVFWYELLCFLIFITMLIILMSVGRKRYHWHGGTISLASTGFLGFAMIIMMILNPFPVLTKLIIIDGLVFLFWMVLFLSGERLHRLHKDRDRYRNVLVELGNQVTTIHDDDALLKLIVQRLVRTTGFNRCCVLLFNQNSNRFDRCYYEGCEINLEHLNSAVWKEIFQTFQHRNILLKNDSINGSIFEFCQAEIILALQRDQFYGLLTLGTTKPMHTLSIEDNALFVALANQLSVALENNAYLRQSNELTKKLTEASVREVYIKEMEKANAALDQKNKALEQLYDELKQTETQLIQSEKMASLGQLVAGISHELNNPVGFIYANLKQLKTALLKIQNNLVRTSSPNEQVNDVLSLIEDALKGSQMVKTLVEHLRRFSHIDQAERKSVNIHEGFETCLMILRPQLTNRIQVHRQFKSSGMLECNIGQLNQVFLNVLSNAAQSISEKGDIWISTEDSGSSLFIYIRDNGSGIAKKNLPKIFDPFFTTKEVGSGTGLGLSISYAIIQQHGGDIHIESELHQGTTVTIQLPLML